MSHYLEKHKQNISNLEDIIESIQSYLNEIHKNSRFRDERNRSESMKEWLNKFIDCKLNLIISFNKVINARAKAESLVKINENSFNQLKEIITEFPELNFNTSDNIHQNYHGQLATRSKQSNIPIYKALEEKKEKNFEIVNVFHSEIEIGFKDYNFWISESEKSLTLKHYDLNLIESIVKKIFQESSLAEHMYSFISTNKFETIHLPTNFNGVEFIS